MPAILDQYGKPISNGRAQRFATQFNGTRTRQAYDAARDTDEFRNHWLPSDSLDADSANSAPVRHKLFRRSRYEAGSNGYYAGIIETHVNMLVGVGPKLRMRTGNRKLNQTVERNWEAWSKRVQLRRKLWCMARARTMDGEAFALLLTNPKVEVAGVQLDVKLIETEQCQSPQLPFFEVGYIDGIRFDQFGNILWYDILPAHPGSNTYFQNLQPTKTAAKDVLHWFKMDRPGVHRGVPAMTSTLNVGACSRRWREATLAAAETAADFTLFMKTQSMPENFTEVEGPNAMDTFEITKRMMVALPDGYDPFQLRAEHPTASYDSFLRQQISETARPLSMPYNAAACDSSTYSFASGKLDTLCYRAALDVERQDCADIVLDPLFDTWFREWTIMRDEIFTPNHQWDWPTHPVIDEVSDASAEDTRLRNGTRTLRDAYSAKGQDIEDEITVMAEDYFGDSDEESIDMMRDILLRTHFPSAQPQQPQGMGSPFGGFAPEAEPEVAPVNGQATAKSALTLEKALQVLFT